MVKTDRENRERRYHGTVCTSAHCDATGLPVLRVHCSLSLPGELLAMLCELYRTEGVLNPSVGVLDGLVTQFIHFSGNTDVLLRDEDAADTRIEQLEKGWKRLYISKDANCRRRE